MQPDYYHNLEIKEVGSDGTFSGVASVYGVEDLGGDVIDKGAFRKTIAENSVVPILFQHDKKEVIGEGTVKEWQGKILLEGRLDMEDPVAAKAHQKMKKRLIKGLSIGFQTIKSTMEEIEGRFVRHITELKLWEVSIVTFPMLPDAQVTRVKAAEAEAFESRIKDLEAKVSALSAAKSTPEPEPVKVEEPPTEGIEPVVDHSALSSLIDNVKGELAWSR